MTRQQFETKMQLTCTRLAELQEVYWTVTDLSVIFTTTPDYLPGWVDVAFLEWVVARRIVTKIDLAPGAVLDVAKDGAACVLFCRHYLARRAELIQERHALEDSQCSAAIVIPALVAMWKQVIKQHGKEQATQIMRARFPGVYGDGYKKQLNNSFKFATDGHQ